MKPSFATGAATIVLAAMMGGTVACASSDIGAPCGAGTYPAAPTGGGALRYVSAACVDPAADGSPDHPFSSIQAALDAAPAGAVVLVAPGTYAENLHVTRAVTLLGSDVPQADSASIILQAPKPEAAVVVSNASGVVIRGLRILSPVVAGVWVVGGTTTIEGCRIEGARAQEDTAYGDGVLVTGGASIILQDNAIVGSARVGAFLQGATGVIRRNTMSGNGRGGVRIERSTAEVTVEANELVGNSEVGIAILSARGIILQNVIGKTAAGGPMGAADGILVAELHGADGKGLGAAEAEVRDGNEVSDNARAGIIFSAGSRGIILQNNVGGNGRAGIWLQGGAGGEAGIEVTKNILSANKLVGIGVTTAARGIILQNTVGGTVASPTLVGVDTFYPGDGVGVLAGGSARVEDNDISKNERFGVVTDGAAGGELTRISGNTIDKNAHFGIILQNTGAAMPIVETNTITGNEDDELKVFATDNPYKVPSAELGSSAEPAPLP